MDFAVPRISLLGFAILLFSTLAFAAKTDNLQELKSRLASASAGEKPRLCMEIADLQLGSASKLYASGESEQAATALSDVADYSEQARDTAIQSRKHLKSTEISARMLTRKLNDLKHLVTHDEQGAVQNTIDRVQRVRDDLLAAMFPKGQK
jgi:hypothetical protein